MKIVCIYHSIDLDGWMSAAIVKHWFESNKSKTNNDPLKSCNVYKKQGCSHVDGMLCNTKECYILHGTLDFIGYNYGQPIPDLSQYDKVIMCDIAFTEDEMFKIERRLASNFIWVDHHISAIKSIHDKGFCADGIRDTRFAACELTWKYFFPNEEMPEIVRLLGRYDCFGSKGTDEEQKVLEYQYGFRSVITNYKEAYKWLLICNNSEESLRDIGIKGIGIYNYICAEAKQSYKNGFLLPILEPVNKGMVVAMHRNFICINKERFNPDNFGIDYNDDGYDGVASFYYDGKLFRFSLYSNKEDVDCSMIASQFVGGGGHKEAAGFELTKLQFNSFMFNHIT